MNLVISTLSNKELEFDDVKEKEFTYTQPEIWGKKKGAAKYITVTSMKQLADLINGIGKDVLITESPFKEAPLELIIVDRAIEVLDEPPIIEQEVPKEETEVNIDTNDEDDE
jgi:hypothetical protein